MRTDDEEDLRMVVTWNVQQARDIVSKAPLRYKVGDEWGSPVQIQIDGEWQCVCRTDLKDDVCTFQHEWRDIQLEDFRRMVLGKISYGARIRRHYGDGQCGSFAVIDAYSDG